MERGSHWQWDEVVEPRNGRVFWLLAAVVLAVDRLSKQWALSALPPGPAGPSDPGPVRLGLTFNGAGPMGLDLGGHAQELLGLGAVALLLVLYLWYRRLADGDLGMSGALGLIAGGGGGNAFDRLTSDDGVIDFIQLVVGPFSSWTFNVADLAIATGLLAVLIRWWARHRPAPSPSRETRLARGQSAWKNV